MRRLLAALLAAVTVLLPHAANAAGPAGPAAATKVVVVGVPGLRWDDVTPTGTPVLWRLARTGAVGALSVKAGPAVSCAADGFLTLGAGARATAYGAACGFAPRDLAGVSARNRTSRERADPSALVAALQRSGLCASADGPLAALVVRGPPEAGGCALVVRQTAPVAATG